MYNCNGTLVSDLSKTPSDLLHSLFKNFSIRENVRLLKGQILFWEKHYFRMIASLRRHRFFIPMNYTMAYFEQEIQKFQNSASISKNGLVQFQFIENQGTTTFILHFQEADELEINKDHYAVDLYKEAQINSGTLSNLSATNLSLRYMARQYANENGFEDVILLNEEKNIVETLRGSLFLVQEDLLLTPALESGCQDFAIRSVFLDWVKKNRPEIQLVEKNLNPFELQKSQKLLILSLEKGVQEVSQYRKTNYHQEKTTDFISSFFKSLD